MERGEVRNMCPNGRGTRKHNKASNLLVNYVCDTYHTKLFAYKTNISVSYFEDDLLNDC